MLFNSYEFILLFTVTFGLYYLSRLRGLQISILIVSSLVFYGYHNFWLLSLLLISVIVNSTTSYFVTYGLSHQRKLWVTSGVIFNLFVLFFFKYSPLFAITFFDTSDGIGNFLLMIPLPIGISFFTFQGISLLIDVYREKEIQIISDKNYLKHLQKTLFFISFFPQLIAGPIVKAHNFFPQIKTKYFSNIRWEVAFRKLVLGYFLKLVVADNLKEVTMLIEYPVFEKFDSLTLLTFLLGYSFQIFADFAGYSLIALGLVECFGYQLMDNFNFPYISSSFKEFWKRWHISLSSFLMEYLYFPLGGNRKGKIRTYLNLLITMVLGGLWHGAAWSYAVWGLFHGLLLAIERFFQNTFKLKIPKFFKFFNILIVFSLVSLGWLLFKLPEFNHVILYLKSIGNNFSSRIEIDKIITIHVYSLPVILYHFYSIKSESKFYTNIRKLDYIIYGFLLFLIITNSGVSGEFIYFQF